MNKTQTYVINPPPWRVVPSTTKGMEHRFEIVSEGAEFSPSFVAENLLKEDAERIVAAVNERDGLLALLKGLADYMEAAERETGCVLNWGYTTARAAIAKATGVTEDQMLDALGKAVRP